MFSDIEVDTAETGDASGLQITLRRSPNGWHGEVAEAAGELGQNAPVAGLVVQAPDSVRFGMLVDGTADTAVFRGRASCDSLWGQQRTFARDPWEAKSYHRVR